MPWSRAGSHGSIVITNCRTHPACRCPSQFYPSSRRPVVIVARRPVAVGPQDLSATLLRPRKAARSRGIRPSRKYVLQPLPTVATKLATMTRSCDRIGRSPDPHSFLMLRRNKLPHPAYKLSLLLDAAH